MNEKGKKLSEILIEISRKLRKRGLTLSAKHFETSSKMLKDFDLDEVYFSRFTVIDRR